MQLARSWFSLACVFAGVYYASGRVNKRSDDAGALEAVIQQLTRDVAQQKADHAALTAEVTSLRTQLAAVRQRAAFLAQFSTLRVTTPASGPYKFDHVVFNDGAHYDGPTGTFTAPVSGVYLFAAQFYLQTTEPNHPVIDFVVNGSIQLRMAFSPDTTSPGHDQDSHSTTLTLALTQGDRVWVEGMLGDNRVYLFWGTVHTFFSGVLLYAQ